MSDDHSNASWHPAFMPDSSVANSANHQTSQTSPDTTEAAHDMNEITAEKAEDTNDVTTGIEDAEKEAQDLDHGRTETLANEDDKAAEGLENLRETPMTSTEDPKGDDVDEIPESHPAQDPEAAVHEAEESHAEELPEKTKLSSHVPMNSVGSVNGISFAQTATERILSDGEDDFEPERRFSRTDIDPFKFMAKSDRTNSFPVVPPAQHPAEPPISSPLAQSQAEALFNESQPEERDLFADDNAEDDDFFGQNNNAEDETDPFQHSGNTADEQEFTRTIGGDLTEEPDFEARYEEGLPLVSTEESVEDGKKPLFDEEHDEESFFNWPPSGGDAANDPPGPGHLERKSTAQVMDSMQYQPHEQVHSPIPEEQEEDAVRGSRSSFDLSTGGGIAASRSTVLSQVFGDPETQLGEENQVASADNELNDVDLAEKWKAALAEDDLLDDTDDLLSDTADPEPAAGIDLSAVFGSDDEGFLEDDDDEPAAIAAAPIRGGNGQVVGFDRLTGGAAGNASTISNRYTPESATPQPQTKPRNLYAPEPFPTDESGLGRQPSRLNFQTTTAGMLGDLATPPMYSSASQQQRPKPPQKAQSFVDKAKGGYASPYDLPMDVVKNRVRPRANVQQVSASYGTSAASVPPPPRSASMFHQGPPPPPSKTPPVPSQSSLAPPPANSRPTSSEGPTLKSKPSFFEELPIKPKVKPTGRYSPQPNQQFPGAQGPPLAPPMATPLASPMAPPPSQAFPPKAQPSKYTPQPDTTGSPALVAPPRASPYAPIQGGSMPPPPLPANQNRYSPAPPAPATRRTEPMAYSRPPLTSQNSSPAFAHFPRTSSPLAHFETAPPPAQAPGHANTGVSSGRHASYSSLPTTREVEEEEPARQPGSNAIDLTRESSQAARSTPPPVRSFSSRYSPSKSSSSSYAPRPASNNVSPERNFEPPRRAMTQSPNASMRQNVNRIDPYQRPSTAEVSPSPIGGAGPYASFAEQTRSQGFSQPVNYVAPTDGREHDPLERWKGFPVFSWGSGGSIVTSFPQDAPRYTAANPTQPTIVRNPGEVKIGNIKDRFPLEDRVLAFPGPLKGKAKKKDVLAWLSNGIQQSRDQYGPYLNSLATLSIEDKRREERILLWEVLRAFVEHDGTLEGSPAVESAVRKILLPHVDDDTATGAPSYATGAELSGISQSATSRTVSDPVDPVAVDDIRKSLLKGDRVQAVWGAVNSRLWGHALLIANTVSPALYKQVAQEFVQKEVKTVGENTEPLAALYDIFAGNFEESVDELVPPSVRAGFQMVSTTNNVGPAKSALEGLDRWRETLGLILSNRSNGDNTAINALGKLLAGYGRAEAAHICFMFARNVAVFSGVDDPATNIVLLGSDHVREPLALAKEVEPILLSEVYEFGLSLSSTSQNASAVPHLSAYKLQHATILAEYGSREKALQYCEALMSTVTSQTRRSPYHHALLVAALDDLSKRLKQSPKDGSSSWITKPTVDKVTGSVWAKFNKFVAGDENDADPSVGGDSGLDVGPFSRIAGETPMISRRTSQADIYGNISAVTPPQNGYATMPAPTRAASRYAPGNSAYTPSASYEPQNVATYPAQKPGSSSSRYAPDARRGSYESERRSFDYPASQPASSMQNSPYMGQSEYPGANGGFTPQEQSKPGSSSSQGPAQLLSPMHYQPSSTFGYESRHSNISDSTVKSSSGEGLYGGPDVSADVGPFSTGYEPPATSGYEPPASSGYEPPASSGYEPPSTSGYEPPSYEGGASFDEPESPDSPKPKKKSFMDDDDDDFGTASKPREKTKAEKDREADEAFRRAAEADAQKDKPAAPKKSGWGLTGWFGGKKESSPSEPAPNKPIRAKLGEESSFVYDPDLKRWVNKKAGKDAATTSGGATPPPPKASGPPRVPSGMGPPPSLKGTHPLSQKGTPPPSASSSRPGTAAGSGTPGSDGPGHGLGLSGAGMPPPPIGRNVSSASLAGPAKGSPLATPAATPLTQFSASPSLSGTAPPSRPGTSMSNASNIDDLLGPPGAGRRTAGKKAKKGRGYIDVMGEKAGKE